RSASASSIRVSATGTRTGWDAGVGAGCATPNTVASAGPVAVGSSVSAVASLLSLPSASKWTLPWLAIDPLASAAIVASMPMVTLPPAGMVPFQVTVPPASAAVPLLAVADTPVTWAGSTSTNSSPALSPCARLPLLASTTVQMTVPPGRKSPDTVLLADSDAPPASTTTSALVSKPLLPGTGSTANTDAMLPVVATVPDGASGGTVQSLV